MANPTVERIVERTRHAKHFDSDEPGKSVAIISQNQHFLHKDTGEWTDIDQLVADVTGGFASIAEGVQIEVANGWITFTRNGSGFRMRPDATYLVDTTNPTVRRQKLGDADMSDIVRDHNHARARNIYPNIHLDIQITESGMRKRWVVFDKPPLPDPVGLGWDPDNTHLLLGWEVDQTGGFTIWDVETNTLASAPYWKAGTLRIEDPSNEPFAYFHEGTRSRSSGAHQRPVVYGRFNGVDFCESAPWSVFQVMDFTTADYIIDPSTDINPSAGGDDGYIWGGTGFYTTTTTNRSGRALANKAYYSYRTYIRFDLSSLSGETCDSASLNMRVNSRSGTHNQMCYWSGYDPFPLATGDWNSILAGGTLEDSIAAPAPASWGVFTLDPNDIETDFGGYCAFEVKGNVETGSVQYLVSWISVDHSTPSWHPYLSVTYSTAPDPGLYVNFDTGTITYSGT